MTSGICNIEIVVPQGSSLGLFFFLMHKNDFGEVSNEIEFKVLPTMSSLFIIKHVVKKNAITEETPALLIENIFLLNVTDTHLVHFENEKYAPKLGG